MTNPLWFTGPEADSFAGLSSGRRRGWDQVGILKPSATLPSGYRRYTLADLLAAKIAKELLERGLRMGLVRLVVAAVQSGSDEELGRLYIVQNLPHVPRRVRLGLVDLRGQGQEAPDPSLYASVKTVLELSQEARGLAREIGLAPAAAA